MVASIWQRAWEATAATATDTPAVIERLDPQRRLMVAMSLVVILVLALLLMWLIWAGGRWVRRLARTNYQPRRTSMIGKSDWEPQPYVPPTRPPDADGER
jgi:hypothetical protein